MEYKDKIESIFNNLTRYRQIHEAILMVENKSGDFSVNYGYGGKTIDTPINSASVGKLFTTSCFIILLEQKKLSLDTPIVDYFDKRTFNGLHRFKDMEYSYKLTLSDLLFQTSGFPDYESEGGIIKRALKEDFSISTAELIELTKTLKPKFAPLGIKAYYSDLNFQLLGEVIEKITKLPLETLFNNFIFKPLGLTKTYVPINNDFVPNVYYKNQVLSRPKLIKSLRGGGNAITTTHELMIFLKAFFNGLLFSKDVFVKLSKHRNIQLSMGPIKYGGGHMKIPLNSIMTLFLGKGELLGHSGSTGSFAFYYPQKDLFFTGDTNQMANPELTIRLVMQLAMSLK
jgi:D-alanyl-D-alanine carboxypeptidase